MDGVHGGAEVHTLQIVIVFKGRFADAGDVAGHHQAGNGILVFQPGGISVRIVVHIAAAGNGETAVVIAPGQIVTALIGLPDNFRFRGLRLSRQSAHRQHGQNQ